MIKETRQIGIAVMSVLFFLGASSAMAEQSPKLDRMVDSGKPIKVFIVDVKNESGKAEIDPREFRLELEKAISERKLVNLDIVKEPAESDVSISCTIKKFQYLEKGPIKSGPGLGGMFLDAAASAMHNYVEMDADFTITETKTNEVLWKDTITDYKKKVMTPKESIPIIYDRVARKFLWKSFERPDND